MFTVLPPPPRYPTQASYNAAVAAGQVVPLIETNNTLGHPTGPEYQFLVGEGTYVLKDDLHLANPPPHPLMAQTPNNNPLATTPQPPTAGTKLSLLSLSSKPSAPIFYKFARPHTLNPSIQEHPHEGRTSTEVGSEAGTGTSVSGSIWTPMSLGNAPAFGEGNALIQPAATKDPSKRRKPRKPVAKSNSSFISRVIFHESLNKRLQEHAPEGLYAFANIGRAFQWLDLSSAIKQDQLMKIMFTRAHCLCHDVNMTTKSYNHLDLIMGFSTGEILWLEPMSQKYSRLNKNGIMNSTPVSDIKWIPGSENLFLAAHMDGALIVYDKEKEDAPFTPEEPETNGRSTDDESTQERVKLTVEKSVESKNQKTNPVAVWKLSNQRINAFAMSPDCRHLAVVAEDGTLRIIDYLKEQLLDLFTSYYGGLSCVCWSPDGKYFVTGGQDDLLSIWSVAEAAIVARCQGHHSWVTAVAFDPWRCDGKNYRIGSVGEDCRLLLWDFNVGMLHRPRALSVRNHGSISSRFTSLQRAETQNTTSSRFRSNSNISNPPTGQGADDEDSGGVRHPVEPRARVPMLPPVMSKNLDKDPLCWVEFTQEAIITSCKSGHIRTWDRPRDGANGSEVTLSSSNAN